MRSALVLSVLFLFSLGGSARSQERSLEVGAHLATTFLHELDTTDVGFGGRFGFQPTSLLGFEGELSFYPSDVPDLASVSASRLEGLFGVKVGPRFDRFAVFGKARPGFMRFGGAPEPVACILIYPPPLSCQLAAGKTVFALDLGGGIEVFPTERALVRVDVSSLLLRYPGPSFNLDREAFNEDHFWGSNLRLTFGAGFRF